MRPGHLGQAVGSVGEPGEDLVPLPVGVGAQLVELASGVFPSPRSLRACVLGPGRGRGRALPGLLSIGAGLVAGGLGGADEGLGLGPGLVDRLPRLLGRAVGAGLGLGDAGGLVRPGPGDRLVALGRRGGDLLSRFRAGTLDLGRCGGAGLLGLSERCGGALLSLLAGSLGGLQLLVHLRRRGAGLFGVGLGLLAALRLAGQAAAGVGDLRDRLGLHRFDLRLGCLRIRGGLQLLGGRGELGHQGGRVGQQAGPQLRRAGGGHGDRPVQVRRGRRAPGGPAVQCRAGPERRHRGVRGRP